MVIYDLICQQGHQFEGWFGSSQAFEKQASMGLVECQFCGSSSVTKLPSGGHIKSSSKPVVLPAPPKPSVHQNNVLESHEVKSSEGDVKEMIANLKLDPVSFVKIVRHYVTTNFENVGDQFAKKAREMAKGEVPEKNIYGKVTAEEREQLIEEDIPVLAIPDLPPEFEN